MEVCCMECRSQCWPRRISGYGWVINPAMRQNDNLPKRIIPGTSFLIVLFAFASAFHFLSANCHVCDDHLLLSLFITGILEAIVIVMGFMIALIQVRISISNSWNTMEKLAAIILQVKTLYIFLVRTATMLISLVLISEIYTYNDFGIWIERRRGPYVFMMSGVQEILTFVKVFSLINASLYLINLYKWSSYISATYQPLAVKTYNNHVTEFMSLPFPTWVSMI